MGVVSKGEYGIPAGLIFSFPVTAGAGNFKVVEGLPLSDFAKAKIAATQAELESERATVASLLG
jgi:malate dehydrogenase